MPAKKNEVPDRARFAGRWPGERIGIKPAGMENQLANLADRCRRGGGGLR